MYNTLKERGRRFHRLLMKLYVRYNFRLTNKVLRGKVLEREEKYFCKLKVIKRS